VLATTLLARSGKPGSVALTASMRERLTILNDRWSSEGESARAESVLEAWR
jgi:hypothetical protein